MRTEVVEARIVQVMLERKERRSSACDATTATRERRQRDEERSTNVNVNVGGVGVDVGEKMARERRRRRRKEEGQSTTGWRQPRWGSDGRSFHNTT